MVLLLLGLAATTAGDQDSVVGTAVGARKVRASGFYLLHTRPDQLGPTQPSVRRVPGLFTAGKAAEA
jgi:hypothetical protein